MPKNERKRQKKLARKNAKRQKTLLAQNKAMAEFPIILEGYPEKMSEVIIDFAEPLLEEADTGEKMRSALSFAIMAWNIALLPPEREPALIDELFDKLKISDEPAREEILMSMAMMVARKRKYYSQIARMVASYQITDTPDGIHLSVASTLF